MEHVYQFGKFMYTFTTLSLLGRDCPEDIQKVIDKVNEVTESMTLLCKDKEFRKELDEMHQTLKDLKSG